MSRTPLFRLLQRSYRAASYSIMHAEPVDEVLDRRDAARQARVGRARRGRCRDGSSSPAPPPSPPSRRSTRCAPATPTPAPTPRRGDGGPPVLIIGAGIAGLTAGYRLRQAGVPFRIIEAQNRVGGRMYSLRNFFADGQVCELGGELIDTPHERIQALAQELGHQARRPLEGRSRRSRHETFHFDGARRSGARRRRRVRAARASRRRGDRAARCRSGRRVSRRDAGGRRARPHLHRPVARRRRRERLVPQAARRRLHDGVRAPARPPVRAQLPAHDRSRSRSRSGSSATATSAITCTRATTSSSARSASGSSDAIETNTVLESVDRRADGTYACSLRRGSSSTTATSPHVIVAMPFTLLRDVRLNVPSCPP